MCPFVKPNTQPSNLKQRKTLTARGKQGELIEDIGGRMIT